jgi:hypothetical protein
MGTMREKWTDERLDDLNHRVDLGFNRVDHRFDAVDRRFDAMDARFDRLESRLDSMQRTTVQAVIALSGAMLAGWAAMIALVATQL